MTLRTGQYPGNLVIDVTRDITCTAFVLDVGSGLVGIQAAPSISPPGKQSIAPGGFAPGPSASRLSIYVQRKLEGFPGSR